MKEEWLQTCLKLSRRQADFYSGARKIIRCESFDIVNWNNDLLLEDAGYTRAKMSMLTRNYYNKESHDVAQQLWTKRLAQDKYGSVGFTTYNHFVKGGHGKRASIMGPCIQGVTLTLMPDRSVSADVFYRTTELFKKFPADLVFLRSQLAPFDPTTVTFHFANITLHSMYYVTIIPHLKDPIGELTRLRDSDEYFHNWVVKWSSRYLIPEYSRGIQKFSQALRVQKDAKERIPKKMMRQLITYLNDNHPGYRGDKETEDDEE